MTAPVRRVPRSPDGRQQPSQQPPQSFAVGRWWHVPLFLFACLPTEMGDLTPIGGAMYDTWFMEVAACLGQEGRSPFEVEIYSTPVLRDKSTGLNLNAIFWSPNKIIMVENRSDRRSVFTHEVVHYLAARGCHADLPLHVWKRCTGKGYNTEFWEPTCR